MSVRRSLNGQLLLLQQSECDSMQCTLHLARGRDSRRNAVSVGNPRNPCSNSVGAQVSAGIGGRAEVETVEADRVVLPSACVRELDGSGSLGQRSVRTLSRRAI